MPDERGSPGDSLDTLPSTVRTAPAPLLRAAIAAANDAFLVTDAQLDPPGPRIVYANPAFERMTGYAAHEIVGRSPRFLQGPGTDRAVLDRLRDDLRHGRNFLGEAVNYRKDGSAFDVEWRITCVRDDAGAIVQWVAVQRDITDRVRLAQQREQALQRERVAREQAESLGRVKDRFLATLSHELRTPLNAIANYANLLVRERGRLPDSSRSAAVDAIVRNVDVQKRLVDDLLDTSAITSGRLRLDCTPHDLVAVADAAIESVRPAIETKGVRFALEVQPGLPSAVCDAVRMQQVFWNLLHNAVRHVAPGGAVTMSLRRERNALATEVRDDGSGIDPVFLPHVFERFSQADDSITRTHGGLGMGLAISRHLVELHGGTLAVHSDGPGRGATFTVRLPLPPPRSTSA